MLTDAECRNAICPDGKNRHRLTDANGLYLEISPGGSKRWFWKTYADGKESRMALGSYPEVPLTGARRARDAARLQKSNGIDPIQLRKIEKLKALTSADSTFKATALEWYALKLASWSSHYADREKRNLEKDLFPFLGARKIGDVESIELLAVVRRVEERGALDVAHRVLTTAGQVWRYAVATGRAKRDITTDIRGALKPHHGKHFAAITDPKKFGELIRVIRGYQGGPIVRAALQLAPMLFQRPTELRAAAWAEFDLDTAMWTIPSARMKRSVDGKRNGDPHTVPLPTQAVEILRKLQPITGHSALCFYGERSHDRPISDNTLRAALLTLGYGTDVQSVHGFRATARTLLAEELGVDPLVIEAQLAHSVKDANGRAYNRTKYIKHRVVMMQKWADYLDQLARGAEVSPLKRA
jgi:integrase